jgi:hypothetical protein
MLGFTKVFTIAAVAAAPLTLAASIGTHAQAEVPSVAKGEALKNIPCPGLAA